VIAWLRSGGWLGAGAAGASVVLAITYLALGGASYEPTPVADPCEPREWRSPEGLDEAAEQFTLSALDGAACELRITRERLAIAIATPEGRTALAEELGIENERLEAAVRSGLERAIDDAEEAGALSPVVATPLREIVTRIPIEEAVALIEDARELFERGRSLFDALGQTSSRPWAL
jgi:hypothetical protein